MVPFSRVKSLLNKSAWFKVRENILFHQENLRPRGRSVRLKFRKVLSSNPTWLSFLPDSNISLSMTMTIMRLQVEYKILKMLTAIGLYLLARF